MKVYFNSKRRLFSLVDKKLIAHSACVKLKSAKFVVSESGRQRVLRERRKNVHAFIVGELTDWVPPMEDSIYYNPYKTSHFMCDGKPILSAPFVLCVIKDGKPIILCELPS